MRNISVKSLEEIKTFSVQ